LAIFRHIPKIQQILSVYGLVVMLVYGWTIYWFAWNLPSWLGFMTLRDILGILAYSFVVNFFESCAVLIALMFFGAILPKNWLRGDFIVVGGFVVIYFLIFTMFLLYNFVYLPQLGKSVAVAFLLFVIVQYAVKRFRFTRVVIEWLADRSVVFLYISIPATVAGLIVVLARNI
jgi:hypothetical protein